MINYASKSASKSASDSTSDSTGKSANQQQCFRALQQKRNQLLERLMPLAEQPVTASAEKIAQPMQEFCQALVNYLAAGHYYIMQHVRGGWPQRAAIAQTTESAMRFAEQHEHLAQHTHSTPSWHVIRAQLDRLALLLTDRFDNEDRLLGDNLS